MKRNPCILCRELKTGWKTRFLNPKDHLVWPAQNFLLPSLSLSQMTTFPSRILNINDPLVRNTERGCICSYHDGHRPEYQSARSSGFCLVSPASFLPGVAGPRPSSLSGNSFSRLTKGRMPVLRKVPKQGVEALDMGWPDAAMICSSNLWCGVHWTRSPGNSPHSETCNPPHKVAHLHIDKVKNLVINDASLTQFFTLPFTSLGVFHVILYSRYPITCSVPFRTTKLTAIS